MSKIAIVPYALIGACVTGIVWMCNKSSLVDERRNNIEARVESYMENRPHAEFTDIQKQAARYGNSGVYMQSSLDSLAYREIFNSSQAATDSAAVNEFNKLASSMKRASNVHCALHYDLYNKLGKMITHKQFNQIEKETNGDILTLQFKADSVAYRRFFEKHGLLNKSTLKKFTATAKKIRP